MNVFNPKNGRSQPRWNLANWRRWRSGSAGLLGLCLWAALLVPGTIQAQPYGVADSGQPGDASIQAYLRQQAGLLETNVSFGSRTEWEQNRPKWIQEYYYMLGLSPLPEKTPLQATITSTMEKDGYRVDNLHYQSRPGLYVTANLYRPASGGNEQRYPAVLYVCGHSSRGRNGGKAAFQSHGIWFARHGYVCLIVDTLQLGEIAGIHHGTYRENRWWWLSRGYTPAGVECWNGIRGIDYLVSRPDVDPDRIAVTGISGGGAATFWVVAADERVKVAVPVSGMADLESYVANRVINGHCDCMFLHNTYQWPWTRIAALVAPRPMLFVNSDADPIFPMDANERVINRLERLYSQFGASDQVDSVVSVGGHAYRQDIRQATYRFINSYLRNNPQPILDSEVDLVSGPREEVHPIPPEQLRAFPTDADIPKDALNAVIDQHFVPRATVQLPAPGQFKSWQNDLLQELRSVSFRPLPLVVPPAELIAESDSGVFRIRTEDGIEIDVRTLQKPEQAGRSVLLISLEAGVVSIPEWLKSQLAPNDAVYVCEPRGIGSSRWTQKNPPNYVVRSLVLLGHTLDGDRVRDVAATANFLEKTAGKQIHLAGESSAGVLAIYAALMDPRISGAIVGDVPESHMKPQAPAFLNVLRVLDVPEAMGLLAPRPLVVLGPSARWLQGVKAIYTLANAPEKLTLKE